MRSPSRWIGFTPIVKRTERDLYFAMRVNGTASARYNRGMNKTQLMLTVIALTLVDFIVPFFPVLGLILIYVILQRPAWFLDSVREIYK